jgi:hypothetical protein
MTPAGFKEFVMTVSETRRYAMLARVRDFGAAHQDRFPESSEGGQGFTAIGAAVAKMDAHARLKLAGLRSAREDKGAAREALLDRIDVAVRTAAAIKDKAPEFENPFQLPRRLTDQDLANAASVIVEEAATHKARFTAYGLPESFVDDLRALLNRFAQAARTVTLAKERAEVAQKGIAAALVAGLTALRQLDVIVPNQLERDPDALAAWQHTRVEYPTRRRLHAAPAAPPPPSAPPAPPAAAVNAPVSAPATAAVEGKPEPLDASGVALPMAS